LWVILLALHENAFAALVVEHQQEPQAGRRVQSVSGPLDLL
jgi:hypothetical protein